MSLDTSAIGQVAAKAMEQISDDFGEDTYVRTVALVVEVDAGDATHILVACTDDRAWTQMAFLEQGIVTLEDQLAAALREDDE